MRWQHPERGLVPPDLFIPLTERTGLIRPLTRYVLDAALQQCRRWQDEGRRRHVAVNISARDLLDEHFVDDVTELLAAWQVLPECLELELTESAIMADPTRARDVLTDLAAFLDSAVAATAGGDDRCGERSGGPSLPGPLPGARAPYSSSSRRSKVDVRGAGLRP